MAKFIDDDKNKGLLYNWKEIVKEYKKLGCPDYVYNPCALPFSKSAYFMLLSERSTGKTTNLLLLGMIMNSKYGTVLQYIRSKESMIERRNIINLFSTIIKFGYIDKITKGQYNSVEYYGKKWFYIKVDEEGNKIDKAPEPFMVCLSIDKGEVYKSSYNAPLGDFIIFDEFISKYYPLNEFVYFLDLLKTIIRDRESCKIFLLANTIDKHSEYFSEFEIYDEVQLLEEGEHDIVTTSKGTSIYLEWISDQKDMQKKKLINSLFFGFQNPKLASIVGGGWATNEYPHIDRVKYKTLINNVYIENHNKLLQVEIVDREDIGICLHVHKASRTYDDSIIYSLEEPKDLRYRFYMGTGDGLDILLKNLTLSHKIKFKDNSCGTLFFNHFNRKEVKSRYN